MATIFVATGGNDGNAGTSGSPKATLIGGLNAANPGDTIQVADGTYTGNVITTKGGTSGNFITFQSENKWGAKIVGNNLDADETAFLVNHPFIRVKNFEVTGAASNGARNGVVIQNDNVEVIGNWIHHTCQFLTGGTSWEGGAGVDVWSGGATRTNLLIEGNKIHDIGLAGSTQTLVHGIYVGQPGVNARIHNNVIYDCEDFGVHCYPGSAASGWKVINNTIADNGRGILIGSDSFTRNNICYNNPNNNYQVHDTSTGTITRSNNLSGGTGDTAMTGVTTGVNPLFTNYATRDLTVNSGSPAINAGTTTDAPATDFLGVTRPQGVAVDIGAYELVEAGAVGFEFNIVKGEIKTRFANVGVGNARLIAIPLEATGLEADATLADYDTVSALLAGTTNEQTTMGRKTISAVTITVDDATNTVKLTLPSSITWTTPTGNAVGKLLLAYDPDITTGTDADLIPLLAFNWSFTPSGVTVVVSPNASGLITIN